MVTIVTIIASVVLMIGLQLLVNKTKMGKPCGRFPKTQAAKLMGINTNGTVAFTFGLGAALAAVGAVLYGAYPMYNAVYRIDAGLKSVCGRSTRRYRNIRARCWAAISWALRKVRPWDIFPPS